MEKTITKVKSGISSYTLTRNGVIVGIAQTPGRQGGWYFHKAAACPELAKQIIHENTLAELLETLEFLFAKYAQGKTIQLNGGVQR